MNNQLSGRRGQYIVQPVVTNGYSRRHFRHIQVMNRVPVREIANMNQLSLRLLRKTSVSTQSVGQSQVDHPVNLFTADRQYVFRVFIFLRGSSWGGTDNKRSASLIRLARKLSNRGSVPNKSRTRCSSCLLKSNLGCWRNSFPSCRTGRFRPSTTKENNKKINLQN